MPKQPKVAYQGNPGAYSQLAIDRYWQGSAEPVACPLLPDVFKAVESGRVDYGLVPLRNSTAGPVAGGAELLEKYQLPVVGEASLPIHHQLLIIPQRGTSTADRLHQIREVRSHPQALSQCAAFFKTHPWLNPIKVFDTAGAARDLAESGKLDCAAIASTATAILYGLQILAKNIETVKTNTTYFVIITKTSPRLPTPGVSPLEISRGSRV